MFKIAALNDKLHQKMVEEGIPDAIAAYVSDDENRVPGDTRKFVAKVLSEKLKAVEQKKKKQIDPTEFVNGMAAEIGQIRDWLTYGTERDGTALNMHKYKTWEDMQQSAHEWHRILAQEMKSKGHPVLYKEDNQEHTLGAFKGGFRMVDVPLCDLPNEGNLMGHCVGRGTYNNGVKEGTTQIISLRDKQGEPHVTIEANKTGKTGWTIRQVQGRGNKPPVDKYKSVLYDFFKDHPEFKFPSWGIKARIMPSEKLAFELAKQFIEEPTSYEVANILERELDATEHQKFYNIITKYFSDKDPDEVAEILTNADPDIIDGLLQTAKSTGNMDAFKQVLHSGSADDSLFGFDMSGKDYYNLPEDIRYSEMMRRFNDPKSMEMLARYLDSMPPKMLASPEWRGILDQALEFFKEHAGENKELDNTFRQDMFGRIAAAYLREDATPEEFADGLTKVLGLALKFPDKRIASHILWIAKRNPDLLKSAISLIDDEADLWALKDYFDAYQLDKKMKDRFESHDEVPDQYIKDEIFPPGTPYSPRLEPKDTWNTDRPRSKSQQWGPLLNGPRDVMDQQIDRGMFAPQTKPPTLPNSDPYEPQDYVDDDDWDDDEEDDWDDKYASLRTRVIRLAAKAEKEGESLLADRFERIAKLCS